MKTTNVARWSRCAMGFAASALLLSACAQTIPACPTDSAKAVQVMVRFYEPAADASGSILQRLQSLSQGCAQSVGSVSPTIHVYRFTGVDGVPLLRQRLLTWSAVADVQDDSTVQRKSVP